MIHREDAEQKALIQWADITPMPARPGEKIGDYLFAIPNGGYRKAREARRLKALGVRPGVSDLFFSVPSTTKHGLYIEMKAPRGNDTRVSVSQATFIERMNSVGYQATVCHGWDEARDAINKYLQ